jgi:hypothetical protein
MTTETQTEATSRTDTDQPARTGAARGKPRTVSNPNDVASLVLMQIDAVNAKKDELTIAVKGLADTAKQLVRAYAEQAAVIEKLAKRVKDLEDKSK